MPYIDSKTRNIINPDIDSLIHKLRDYSDYRRKGITNYVVSRMVAGSMKPIEGWTYSSLSDAIAVLRDAATEMERRLMAAYEDECIQKNGDLSEYKGV